MIPPDIVHLPKQSYQIFSRESQGNYEPKGLTHVINQTFSFSTNTSSLFPQNITPLPQHIKRNEVTKHFSYYSLGIQKVALNITKF